MNDRGEVLSSGNSSYEIQIPHPGFAEQDADILQDGVCAAVGCALNTLDAPVEISGVGLSGQMHGLVLLDQDMKPVRPVIIWLISGVQRSSWH